MATIYDTSTLGTTINRITFNDDTSSVYFRMRSRTPSRRDIRDFETVLPEGSGISDTESFIGKMYMIFEGTMYPADETTYHEGREQLRKLSSLAVAQDDANSDNGYVLYQWQENVAKQLSMKILYVDMAENTRLGIKQPFRILAKIKYPVIYSQASKTVSLGLTAAVSGGGAVYPFTFPVIYGASSSEGQAAATNTGDVATWPSIVIYGPIQNPKITNVTTGQKIDLTVNLATAADTCVITYDQDSLEVTANGVNAYGTLTTDSTLFKIKTGINDLTLTGSTIGSGAYATVSFRDAWPVS